jgi:hypothetical protein
MLFRSRQKANSSKVINTLKYFFTGLFFIIALSSSAEILTDINGRKIEVELLKIRGDIVDVRRADGIQFSIPFERLNGSDRERLKSLSKGSSKLVQDSATFNYKALNELLELELWHDGNLWDDSPKVVAARLKWPAESETKELSSYRIYFKDKHSIAAATPSTAVLYGKNGLVDHLSILFANKGDSVTNDEIEATEKTLKSINATIKSDSKKIETRLSVLGKSVRKSMGKGKAMKERVLRWDVENTSFLLATVENAYLALRIMPKALADERGQPERINNTEAKARARSNVKTNDFGDVLIQNIPMVDQGPKGYCVPATMERCLRYMGIRADMYTLANVCNTGLHGGTYLNDFISGTNDYVSQAGRKLRSLNGNATIRNVRKFIKNGQPVLWAMHSTKAYNDLTNIITPARAKAEDKETWKRELSKLVKNNSLEEKITDNEHLCLIVGYNEYTGELAVSDSWGPEFELRWTSEIIGEQISQGLLYIIDF